MSTPGDRTLIVPPAAVAPSGDLDGREHTLYAAYLAVSFASVGSGLHHKICHVLVWAYNLPHAQTHAVVLPYVLAFNGPTARRPNGGSPKRSAPTGRRPEGRNLKKATEVPACPHVTDPSTASVSGAATGTGTIGTGTTTGGAPCSCFRSLRRYRARSAKMVRTTRQPSRAAFRLLTPWMRLYSKLGTSATRSPALATRT